MFSPPRPILLPVPSFLQQADADCLAACALMVLTYHGRSISYRQLLRLLGTKAFGTPFSNLRQLEQRGVQVTVTAGSLEQLYLLLNQNIPAIVSVQTSELPHWDEASEHAVVVVGMNRDFVLINDPAFDVAPILVPHGDFDLAWLAQEELYGVIRP